MGASRRGPRSRGLLLSRTRWKRASRRVQRRPPDRIQRGRQKKRSQCAFAVNRRSDCANRTDSSRRACSNRTGIPRRPGGGNRPSRTNRPLGPHANNYPSHRNCPDYCSTPG